MIAMKQTLKELFERAETWPEQAQAELIELGHEIEAEHGGVYHASPEELEAIDAALGEIERGQAISEEDAEAMFSNSIRSAAPSCGSFTSVTPLDGRGHLADNGSG